MRAPSRVVLLGASNARMGLPAIFEAARSLVGGPIELLAAIGHGRSYGRWSSIPGRSLPGILDCGLWRELADRPPAPSAAVVTDVGNDLLYGVEPGELVEWVAACVERLRSRNARVVLTELPLANLTRLDPLRYRFFRTLFFPACPLTLAEIADRARAVNDGLRLLASPRRIATLKPRAAWYGCDPIHVRRRIRSRVWEKILRRAIRCARRHVDDLLTTRERWLLQLAAPEQRRVLMLLQRRSQPSWRRSDNSSASFF